MNVNLSLWDWLGQIPDPRNSSGRRYSLQSILGLITAGMLSGQTSLRSISKWGRKLSRSQLELFDIRRKNSPSQTTMHYLLIRLDPVELERLLSAWFKTASARSLCNLQQIPTLSALPSLHSLQGLTREYRVLHLLAACCATVTQSMERMTGEFKSADLRTAGIEAIRELLQRIPVPDDWRTPEML